MNIVVMIQECYVLDDVLEAVERFGWLGSAEAYALHRDLLASSDAGRMDARVRCRLQEAAGIDQSDVASLRAIRDGLMARSESELEDCVLLLPTVSHPPPMLSEIESDPSRFAAVNLASLRLTAPASFLDLPAVTLPAGEGMDGLWSGLQLVMRTGQDGRLLGIAQGIEAELRGAQAETEVRR